MVIIHVKDFALAHTLQSGQFFRYHPEGEGFFVQWRKKAGVVAQNGTVLRVEGFSREEISRLLGLTHPYQTIVQQISNDTVVAAACKRFHGLRIMKQDPWECLVAFVCSAASNIPRITQNVEDLASSFGDKVTGFSDVWSFPRPGEIKAGQLLRSCKLGFREKYVLALSDSVTESWLNRLSRMDYVVAKEELVKLPGVGEKIADCVCLFGLGHLDAFPVDVWIRRVMQEKYFGGKNMPVPEVVRFGQSRFGEFAGYAQQFLYHASRSTGL